MAESAKKSLNPAHHLMIHHFAFSVQEASRRRFFKKGNFISNCNEEQQANLSLDTTYWLKVSSTLSFSPSVDIVLYGPGSVEDIRRCYVVS